MLAAVVSGLYSGWHAPSAFDAETRLAGTAFWRVLTFGLEATLFVLLGLQAPVLAEELEITTLAAQAVVVALVVVGVRMAWALLPPVGAGDTVRERIAVGWSGMRGAISLAAALAVRPTVDERPQILLITFGVIAVTLLGQGLTLPLVLRLLRLPGENRWSPDEAVVRLATAQAALDRLEELEGAGAPQEPLERLRDLYRARFAQCVEALGAPPRDRAGRSCAATGTCGATSSASSAGRSWSCGRRTRSPPTCCGAWSATSTSRKRALPRPRPPAALTATVVPMTEPIEEGPGATGCHARPATGACWTRGSRSRASAWTG